MASDIADSMELCRVPEASQAEIATNHALAATAIQSPAINTRVLNDTASNAVSSSESSALHFQTEPEAVAKLTALAVEYWSSIFGRSNASLYDDRWLSASDSLSYVSAPSSANNRVFASQYSGSGAINYTNVQTSGVDESDLLCDF